ncbi:MAG: transposase [Terracidiphilus sp.]
MQTVPGIGAYAAMVILAELGDVQRFQNKRALASYAGLTPGGARVDCRQLFANTTGQVRPFS